MYICRRMFLEVRTSRLLGVEIEGIEKYIMDLCMERKTVMKEIEGEIRIYPSRFYYMELMLPVC